MRHAPSPTLVLARRTALLLFCLWFGGLCLSGCERDPANDDGAAETAPVPKLDVSLTLLEGDRRDGLVVGTTEATLVIDGATATLSWQHAPTPEGPPPPSGTVTLDDEALARVVKIIEKTEANRSLTVDEEPAPSGRYAMLTGHIGLEDQRGDYRVVVNTSVPNEAHSPAGKDGVFKIDAVRALLGEVARALAGSP